MRRNQHLCDMCGTDITDEFRVNAYVCIHSSKEQLNDFKNGFFRDGLEICFTDPETGGKFTFNREDGTVFHNKELCMACARSYCIKPIDLIDQACDARAKMIDEEKAKEELLKAPTPF